MTARRRLRERGKQIRRGVLTAGLVLLLCALAMSESLKGRISSLLESGVSVVCAFSDAKEEVVELTLEEIEIYALQLGVYDSGERALSEQQRLASQGVSCVIWQRDKMRLICDAAASREALDLSAAGGNEAYIIRDTLPQVRLRLSCAADECGDAAAFAALPDTVLVELLLADGRPLDEIQAETRWLAQKAIDAHPENELYTGLAKSLLEWCDAVNAGTDQKTARRYASLLIYTICREWRSALLNDYSLSTESTASAQRTPSTAADVMPPA